jgi:hypothetical protein
MLKTLHAKGALPIFSGDQLANLKGKGYIDITVRAHVRNSRTSFSATFTPPFGPSFPLAHALHSPTIYLHRSLPFPRQFYFPFVHLCTFFPRSRIDQDPDQNILVVPETASKQDLAVVDAKIAADQLVEADVWIARQIRHGAVTKFFTELIELFYQEGQQVASESLKKLTLESTMATKVSAASAARDDGDEHEGTTHTAAARTATAAPPPSDPPPPAVATPQLAAARHSSELGVARTLDATDADAISPQ